MVQRARNPDRIFPGRKAQALRRSGQGLNVVGQRLREARLAQNPPCSLDELSSLLDQQLSLQLSIGTLSKIERGLRSVYDFEVNAFCQVLKIRPDWLLGFDLKPLNLDDSFDIEKESSDSAALNSE
ncbi:hypothetical protein [Deinococcus altitudinis]|uniref:hypothetical protein n=1 Tax=Deinococcus altitudinis TaxID=468914 RepID=UPI003891DBA6